ncbi:F0F1 ATP synthase subunit epsilon [bacterium]|nr:F0F1 ATP synthase subunit epsilon [bacterium]
MAEATMHLVISSVGENLYDGSAISVTLPAAGGEMTVLPDHEPLVTTLKAGKITVRIPNAENKEFTIEGGVLETSGTRTVVLV